MSAADRAANGRNNHCVLEGFSRQLQLGGSLINHGSLVMKAVYGRLVTGLGTAMLNLSRVELFLRNVTVLDQRLGSVVAQTGFIQRGLGLSHLGILVGFQPGGAAAQAHARTSLVECRLRLIDSQLRFTL